MHYVAGIASLIGILLIVGLVGGALLIALPLGIFFIKAMPLKNRWFDATEASPEKFTSSLIGFLLVSWFALLWITIGFNNIILQNFPQTAKAFCFEYIPGMVQRFGIEGCIQRAAHGETAPHTSLWGVIEYPIFLSCVFILFQAKYLSIVSYERGQSRIWLALPSVVGAVVFTWFNNSGKIASFASSGNLLDVVPMTLQSLGAEVFSLVEIVRYAATGSPFHQWLDLEMAKYNGSLLKLSALYPKFFWILALASIWRVPSVE